MPSRLQVVLTWCVTVSVAGGLGSLGGRILGYYLYRLSYDYIVIPAEYQDWGLRFGILVGTVLAACQGVNSALSYSKLGPIALGVLSVGIITGLGIGAGTGVAHLFYHQGWWSIASWQLPNPSRHALLVGAVTGRNYGAALGLGVGAIVTWKSGQH